MELMVGLGGWLLLASLTLLTVACAGRAGHQEDLGLGYAHDTDRPLVAPGP